MILHCSIFQNVHTITVNIKMDLSVMILLLIINYTVVGYIAMYAFGQFIDIIIVNNSNCTCVVKEYLLFY